MAAMGHGRIPATMRAAVIDACGPWSAIEVRRIPVPSPGAGEVLIEVAATTVNRVDAFVRSGIFHTALSFPFVVGRDAAGTVVDDGDGTGGIGVGEAVWCNSLGHAGRQGATAEYAAVPTDRLYRLPPGVDPIDAVAVLHPAATAALALGPHARLGPEDTCFIAGAAGHVGSAALAIATRAGSRTLVSAGVGELSELLRGGADVALDYRATDLANQIAAAAPEGVDVWLDASGAQPLSLAVGHLALRGRIVVIAGMDRRHDLRARDLYTRDGSILGFAISNATVAELAGAARLINSMLVEQSLPTPRIERLPLEHTADAHRRMEAGAARGVRLIITP